MLLRAWVQWQNQAEVGHLNLNRKKMTKYRGPTTPPIHSKQMVVVLVSIVAVAVECDVTHYQHIILCHLRNPTSPQSVLQRGYGPIPLVHSHLEHYHCHAFSTDFTTCVKKRGSPSARLQGIQVFHFVTFSCG